MLLVVIPLSSDHNDPLCTASLHVRTFSGEDPTPGNSPCFSCVRRCKCPLYKPKTDCLTRVQAALRAVLYALVMYTCRCTTRCYTRSHICLPLISSHLWYVKLGLAAVRDKLCGRSGEEKHSYLSLYRNVVDTEEQLGSPRLQALFASLAVSLPLAIGNARRSATSTQYTSSHSVASSDCSHLFSSRLFQIIVFRVHTTPCPVFVKTSQRHVLEMRKFTSSAEIRTPDRQPHILVTIFSALSVLRFCLWQWHFCGNLQK